MIGKVDVLKALMLNMAFLLIFTGCATTPKKAPLPSFQDYKPKNAQEAEVYEVVALLCRSWKKAKTVESLLHFFDENVVMITDYPKNSFKPGRLEGIKNNMDHWRGQLPNWKRLGTKNYPPVEFIVKGDKASVVYPYKYWIVEWLYWEIGRVHLTLNKKEGQWVITKWVWDLIDTNATNYDPKLWEREKKKFLSQKWIDNQDHPASRQTGPD